MQDSSSVAQLRRRKRMARDTNRQNAEEAKIRKHLSQNNNAATQIYCVRILGLFLLLFSLILYVEPRILQRLTRILPVRQSADSKKYWRLTMVFPPYVNLSRDLPLLTGTYAIETDSNEQTRAAVTYVHQQRSILKSRAYQLAFRVLEQEEVQYWADSKRTKMCGDEFHEIYSQSPLYIQHDLLYACWLGNNYANGVLPFHIEFSQAIPSMYENVAIMMNDESNTMLSPFLLLQSNTKSILPTRWFNWIVEYVKRGDNLLDEPSYRAEVGKQLFAWIQQDQNVQWILWDAVCGDSRHEDGSRRLMATYCPPHEEECCNIYDRFGNVELAAANKPDENNNDNEDTTTNEGISRVTSRIRRAIDKQQNAAEEDEAVSSLRRQRRR